MGSRRKYFQVVNGMGFHSARRKFASEMKGMNLRDLAYLGGWKNSQTVLNIRQQPDISMQREAIAGRRKPRAAGSTAKIGN
jgi:hypothetical protein